jgi:hypothetical protein
MPFYDYHCDCGAEWEAYNEIHNRDNEVCDCGRPAKRNYKLNAKPVVLEYYSEGLGAHITGPRQKSQIMKQKNVSEVGRVT